MLHVITPKEILLNEASRNETVSSLIKYVNDLLFEEEAKYSYNFKVSSSENFSKRELYLLEKVFTIYGWCISISTTFNDETKEYNHNLFLVAK